MGYNQDYQRQLAETLVEGCGIQGAIEFAQANCWEGVLAQIIAVGGRSHDCKEKMTGAVPIATDRTPSFC